MVSGGVVASAEDVQATLVDLDGLRVTPRRRLDEEAHSAVVKRVRARRGPGVVRPPARHSRAAALHEAVEHGIAKSIQPLEQCAVDRRIYRLRVWRNENPRAQRAHLVQVDRQLRTPQVLDAPHDRQNFGLRGKHPIPVEVVTGIAVLQEREAAAIVGAAGAQPRGHEVGSVGIHRGGR
jgi:hypothetical protein